MGKKEVQMRTGRPLSPLQLTDEERETLQQWNRRPKTAQALAQRAGIVLACAGGKSNSMVASMFHVTPQTVSKWRSRVVGRPGHGGLLFQSEHYGKVGDSLGMHVLIVGTDAASTIEMWRVQQPSLDRTRSSDRDNLPNHHRWFSSS